eukprot:4395101-Pyramimonas_sp.AAC.1
MESDPANSAWALCVLSESDDVYRYEGFLSAVLTSCVAFEVTNFSSVIAETAGLLWALLYSRQLPSNAYVEILSDCEPAIARVTTGAVQSEPFAILASHVHETIRMRRKFVFLILTGTTGTRGTSLWTSSPSMRVNTLLHLFQHL